MPIYTDKRTGKRFIQFDIDHKTYKKTLPLGESAEVALDLERQWRSQIIRKKIIDEGFTLPPAELETEGVLGRRSSKGFVYVVQCAGIYKIGYTRNMNRRLGDLRRGNATEIRPVVVFKVSHALLVEKYLHKVFASRRVHGEWFRLNTDDLTFLEALATLRTVPLRQIPSLEVETNLSENANT